MEYFNEQNADMPAHEVLAIFVPTNAGYQTLLDTLDIQSLNEIPANLLKELAELHMTWAIGDREYANGPMNRQEHVARFDVVEESGAVQTIDGMMLMNGKEMVQKMISLY